MKRSKLTLAIVTALGASASASAVAMDHYVDTKTKQIYAEPGPHRQLMRAFEKVENAPAKTADKAEVAAIREDLALKDIEINELKVLLLKLADSNQEQNMKISKLTLEIATVLGASASASAVAMDHSVDTKTKQIHAEPDPHRPLMGAFEKVANAPAKTADKADKLDQAEVAAIREDLELKDNKINALEEHMADFPVKVDYGDKGLEFKTKNGKFSAQIQHRLQFRYANPFDKDPRSLSDLQEDQSSFMIRRARLKVGGHAFWPWMKYYMQYDWSQPILRDAYLNVGKFKWAELRLGRGKVLWNAERVVSSGQQQFVNRSIVNDIFTVDRQQGAQLHGRLFPDTWHDFNYAVGVFSGTGVGERNNDDDNMMYTGRLQWNFLGDEIQFSQSDLKFTQKPAASLAFAAATNQSKCTAFETASDSCRALPGFKKVDKDSPNGQYRVNQMMEEFRVRWQGLSLDHEFHWKQVDDTLKADANPTKKTHLQGSYASIGYLPNYRFPVVPKQLEFAFRYAFVDPNVDIANNNQTEATAAVNWFFNKHNNKLTFEISHLTVEDPQKMVEQAENRARMQWDVSF